MELQPASLFCLWDSPGKNTGVDCHFLLQGIFLTQGWNPGLPHCMQILYRLSHKGSPDSKVGVCQVGKGILDRGICPKAEVRNTWCIWSKSDGISRSSVWKVILFDSSGHTELSKVESHMKYFAPNSMLHRRPLLTM